MRRHAGNIRTLLWISSTSSLSSSKELYFYFYYAQQFLPAQICLLGCPWWGLNKMIACDFSSECVYVKESFMVTKYFQNWSRRNHLSLSANKSFCVWEKLLLLFSGTVMLSLEITTNLVTPIYYVSMLRSTRFWHF